MPKKRSNPKAAAKKSSPTKTLAKRPVSVGHSRNESRQVGAARRQFTNAGDVATVSPHLTIQKVGALPPQIPQPSKVGTLSRQISTAEKVGALTRQIPQRSKVATPSRQLAQPSSMTIENSPESERA